MSEIWDLVQPEPGGPKLENAAVGLLLDHGKTEGIAIERNRARIGMGGTFDGNVGAAGKLRSMNVGYHIIDLTPASGVATAPRGFFRRALSPGQLRFPRPGRECQPSPVNYFLLRKSWSY